MSAFRDTVYALTRNIPMGKVATYGQLARLAGSPGAARAVGLCMKQNPHAPHTPCHRVVSSSGKLTGYSAGGIARKKELLLQEGVIFKKSTDTVDLDRSQWLTKIFF